MAKNRKKELTPPPPKKKKIKEVPATISNVPSKSSKWQEFINKHAVSKQQ